MHEDQENHGESILQAVERQAITQYLIEILACSLTSKEYNVVEVCLQLMIVLRKLFLKSTACRNIW